jgi:hypothetical protein
VVVGSPSGGLPVPQLQMAIDPPRGLPDPEVTESFGGTTTINNDTHVRVWVVQVPEEGTYRVTTDGQVNGYITPRLAFGHGSTYGWLWWLFGGLLGLGALGLAASLVWLAGTRRAGPPIAHAESLNFGLPTMSIGEPASWGSTGSYTPTDDGVRLEQLKTIAALRDSGALTEEEFEAEKRRILNG